MEPYTPYLPYEFQEEAAEIYSNYILIALEQKHILDSLFIYKVCKMAAYKKYGKKINKKQLENYISNFEKYLIDSLMDFQYSQLDFQKYCDEIISNAKKIENIEQLARKLGISTHELEKETYRAKERKSSTNKLFIYDYPYDKKRKGRDLDWKDIIQFVKKNPIKLHEYYDSNRIELRMYFFKNKWNVDENDSSTFLFEDQPKARYYKDKKNRPVKGKRMPMILKDFENLEP